MTGKIKYIAKVNKRSMNKEIEYLILKHIEKWEAENKKNENNLITRVYHRNP